MAQVIKIKSSSDNASFPSLAAGELAYSADSAAQKLAIGHPDGSSGNLIIGGKVFMDMLDHTAGTLTASSAIITDASNKIDQLIVDDITINGSTISDAGAFDLDVGGNITFDADGGTITFADGGSSLGTITSSGYSGNSATATTASVATTVTVSDNEATNEDNKILFAAGAAGSGNLGVEADGDLTYNPSTGTLTATTFSGSFTGTISGTASNVTVSDSTANTDFPIVFHDESNALLDDTGAATYNPSTGTLTATTFVGALTGNASGSSGSCTGNSATATLASTVTVTDNSGSTARPVVFHDESNGLLDDTGSFTYKPSTGEVTATKFIGALTGNVTGNCSGTAATVTGAAQSNITSLGTLTTLTVDDITINGSTISDAGAFDLDVGGNITFDADGGTITFADGGSSLGTITSSGFSGNAATATSATLASTVTVTDSTANTAFPIVFHNESNGLLDDTGAFTYNPSSGLVTIPNLTVSGTTTTLNTETITLEDNIIQLNSNKSGAPSGSDSGGIEVNRGDGVTVFLRYNDGGTGANATDGRWQFAIPSNSSDNAVTTSNILSVANFESEITTLDGGTF